MKSALPCLALASLILACAAEDTPTRDAAAETPAGEPAPPADAAHAGLYALDSRSLEGESRSLADYAGQVTLVVNVASECGYTPQYAGLQELHATFRERGFNVLGFPSNEFGQQEPGGPEQIRDFCSKNFGVTFPLFEKCRTQPGDGQSEVYAFLQDGTDAVPNWNFCKYLVGRDGRPIGFYPSKTAPDDSELREHIERALAAQ